MEQKMEQAMDFYHKLLRTSLSVGLPVISRDTSARILAVIYGYGNNEAFAMSPKLTEDIKYIQERFGIKGGAVPEKEFADLLRWYIKDIELYDKNKHDTGKPYPDWATRLFKDRYGIKLIN